MSQSWQPTATIDTLKKRAALFSRIREFFAKRGVLEVETPLMSHASVTDPYIISMTVNYKSIGSSDYQTHYLQTSPEYAMKRLLAAGSGAIYQLSKAFRQGEVGRLHNPEFTMLEWYRPGFDHHALMDEMSEFFKEVMQIKSTERMTVHDVFQQYLNINPHQATLAELMACARQHVNDFSADNEDRNFFLDLLFSHCIEPHLGQNYPLFLYDFPVSQAALAKIRPENPPVASRFEVYFKGIELANGFHELQDAEEQRKRFENNVLQRQQKQLDAMPIDERFLSALKHGIPDCAGVAMGIDRLCMLASGCESIAEVLSFAYDKA